MNLKVLAKAKKFPQSPVRLFKELNEVEIREDDRVVTKKLKELSQEDLPKITKFLFPELTFKYHYYPVLSTSFHEEAKLSALENREPYYIPLISQLIEVKLRSFEQKQWERIASKFRSNPRSIEKKQMQEKHRYALLLSIYATLEKFQSIAEDAAAWAMDDDMPNGFPPSRIAARSAAWSTARDQARVSTNKVVNFDIYTNDWFRNIRNSNTLVDQVGSENGIEAVLEESIDNSNQDNNEKVGRLSYRISELHTFLYLLGYDNFDDWMKPIYDGIFGKSLTTIRRPGSTLSQETNWNDFIRNEFGSLDPVVSSLLQPWINVLNDRTI